MSKVTKSVIVKGLPAEIYDYWTDFENFPKFMTYIKEVTPIGANTSHWVMAAPAGTTVDWKAELTRVDDNTRIAWSSKDHEGTLTTSGQATFTALPGDQTQVTVTMQYAPPGGKAGELIARLFAKPDERLETDLRNFKQMVEKAAA